MAKKRNRIPKRIAGVKVPKAIRRGRVGRFLASPVGQALMVETMTEAGRNLIGHAARPGSVARDTVDQSRDALSELGASASESSEVFVYALRQAARAFVAAVQERRSEGADGVRDAKGGEETKLEKKARGEGPERATAH